MRIAILGTGRIGAALGARFSAGGHEVWMGSRDPERGRLRAEELYAAGGGGHAEVAAGADAVVLAVPWSAARATLFALGDLDDTIVIDVTNPVKERHADGRGTHLDWSGAEQLQAIAPRARVVKAFNTLSSEILREPPGFEEAPTIFLAGDDRAAVEVVAGLAAELGYEAVDAGAVSASRYLEPLAGLMMRLDRLAGGGTEHALRLLRRERPRPAAGRDGRAEVGATSGN